MITLFDLWEKFTGEANTHQGGFIRPNRQFPNWVNDIHIEIFNEEYAAFEKSQIISDWLTPYLMSKPVKVTPGPITYDIIEKPLGYEFFADCRFYHKGDYESVSCTPEPDGTYNTNGLTEQKVTKVDNMRWGAAAGHKIKKPSLQKPFITQYDKGFKIIPKKIKYVILDWFRTPKTATFNYTLGPDDQIIYDPSSIPLEVSVTKIGDFMDRLISKYGTFTRDQMLFQIGESKKETTI